MKKLFALVLTVALLTPMTLSVFATDLDTSTIIYNDEFNFQLVETVDENNRIIRTYEKDEQPQARSTYGLRSNDDEADYYERTKALLSDLGMGDAFISELSNEQLESYSDVKSITGIVSYTKSDIEGNVTYVSEKEASVYRSGPNFDENIFDDGGSGSAAYETDSEDSYMRLYYMVIYYGDALYKHIVTAEWLTMPICTSYDSLGVCSTWLTVELGSRYGWYSYDRSRGTIFGAETTNIQTNFTTSDFHQPSSGNWHGAGVIFNLPETYSANGVTQIIRNFKVYFEYESRVQQPQQETYIETNATYEHSLIDISFSPSLEISSSEIGCSIGISANWEIEQRSAYFDTSIHYIP